MQQIHVPARKEFSGANDETESSVMLPKSSARKFSDMFSFQLSKFFPAAPSGKFVIKILSVFVPLDKKGFASSFCQSFQNAKNTHHIFK